MATFYHQYLFEEEGNLRPNTLIEAIILSVISFILDKQITAERHIYLCVTKPHHNKFNGFLRYFTFELYYIS